MKKDTSKKKGGDTVNVQMDATVNEALRILKDKYEVRSLSEVVRVLVEAREPEIMKAAERQMIERKVLTGKAGEPER